MLPSLAEAEHIARRARIVTLFNDIGSATFSTRL